MPSPPPSADEPPPAGSGPGVERHLARIEVNRRRVNEAIERGRRSDEPQVFVCECGQPGCNTTLTLTLTQYEAARTSFDRFLVVPDHVIHLVDEVIERHERHVVVAKRGEGREGARDSDARTALDEPA